MKKLIILTIILIFFWSCKSSSTKFQEEEEVFLDLEWITIPAGEYSYGYPTNMLNDIDYDFDIMKYEVTNQQYIIYLQSALDLGFVNISDGKVEGWWNGGNDWEEGYYEYLSLSNYEDHIYWDGSLFQIKSNFKNHPVVYITWFGANAFAEFYNLTLPSEYEWEKAARGNTYFTYPWGNQEPTCELTHYLGCGNGTKVVGQTMGISPYSVFDMAGNVDEWTITINIAPYSSGSRIRKGGGWRSRNYQIRTFSWYGGLQTRKTDDLGFRCIQY